MRKFLYIAAVSVLASYALVFMEWLFFATKPSFLSILNRSQQALLTGATTAPLVLAALAIVLVLSWIALLWRNDRFRSILAEVALIVPTVIFGCLFLLMADNFANTVLNIGILKTPGAWRIVPGIIAGWLFWLGYMSSQSLVKSLQKAPRLVAVIPMVVLLGMSAVTLLVTGSRASSDDELTTSRLFAPPERKPNILIFGSDGLEAKNFSAYGYERVTTPFMDTLVEESLLCENAFSNSANTGGSLTSMLTGRLPTTTRVMYTPDKLQGVDGFLHLPGILKKYGYQNFHIGVRDYCDPFDFNFREGFDLANFRRSETARVPTKLTDFLGEEAAYLAEQILKRINARITHITTGEHLADSYREVTRGKNSRIRSDSIRLRDLQQFIRRNREQPWFAHVHMMETHGPKFMPHVRRFSLRSEQNEDWMVDYYDDSILTFDNLFKQVVMRLESLNLLENTIIIISSDHGMLYRPESRLPLIIRFPNGDYAGRLSQNVQYLDLAPTILDYMGAEVPEWMVGRSLISDDLDPHYPVISCKVPHDFKDRGFLGYGPFHTLGAVLAIVCNQTYRLQMSSNEFSTRPVDGHTDPCDHGELPEPEQMRDYLINLLADEGYDTSTLSDVLMVEERAR